MLKKLDWNGLLTIIVGLVVATAVFSWGVIEAAQQKAMGEGIHEAIKLHGHTASETELRLKAQIIVYGLKPEQAREVAEQIYRYAHLFGRDPELVLALAKVESNCNPAARSNKDAVGLIQVRESWAGLMKDPCDLSQMDCNLRQGLKVLGIYEELFGSLELALTAYNRGENVMHADILNNRDPKNGFAATVLKTYEEIKGL